MASTSRFTALELASITALLPIAADAGKSALVSSTRFGPFTAGDSLVVASTQPFHALAGSSSVVATTSQPKFAAGVYKFVMPDECTHVALIDASDGAGEGQVYRG